MVMKGTNLSTDELKQRIQDKEAEIAKVLRIRRCNKCGLELRHMIGPMSEAVDVRQAQLSANHTTVCGGDITVVDETQSTHPFGLRR